MPQAKIHFFTEKKCAPVLYNHPHIERIWELDKKKLSTVPKQIAFYREIAAQQFDLLVDFQQLPRTRLIAFFSRARYRLTFTPPWYNRPFYTHWRDVPKGYAAAVKATALEPLGATWQGEAPTLRLTDDELEMIDGILFDAGLRQGEILISVDPTHKRASRRWPTEYFADTLRKAAASRPGLRFVILAGPGEEKTKDALADAVGPACLTPILHDLRLAAAAVKRAALHFGACSAPRHMAVAVGTPSLVIPGASGDGWRYPSNDHVDIDFNPGCRPCRKADCNDLKCLLDLAPDMVLPKLEDALDRALERSMVS